MHGHRRPSQSADPFAAESWMEEYKERHKNRILVYLALFNKPSSSVSHMFLNFRRELNLYVSEMRSETSARLAYIFWNLLKGRVKGKTSECFWRLLVKLSRFSAVHNFTVWCSACRVQPALQSLVLLITAVWHRTGELGPEPFPFSLIKKKPSHEYRQRNLDENVLMRKGTVVGKDLRLEFIVLCLIEQLSTHTSVHSAS